jgi:uncharacterized protein (TIGR02996 family)
MRTFTFTEGKTPKFWSIDLQGNRFTVTQGRQGTAGRSHVKEFGDGTRAQKAHDRLVRQKLDQGFVEDTPAPPVPPLRAALEEALTADPDDLAAHMAYADYLQEQGDPRGEFIQVQLALEQPRCPAAERKRLEQRERALLKAHGDEWVGPLATLLEEDDDPAYSFARGWLDQLTIQRLDTDLARLLVTDPRVRLLRKLAVDAVGPDPAAFDPAAPDDEPAARDVLRLLSRSPYLGNVRAFHLGTTEGFREDDVWACVNAVWDLPNAYYVAWELIARMPRLEELYLQADTLGIERLFGSKSLTNLRVLQVYFADEYPLDVLANNPALGRLTHLSLRPRSLVEDEGAGSKPYLRLPQVKALVRSPHLPSLTHLRLHQCDMGDKGCREIVRSGALKRLKFLDVARGCITDEGARVLAECPDLPNLDLLDVSYNELTDDGLRFLEETGVNVRSEYQHDAGDDRYLYEGEME